jgi:hypothetical protein
MSEVRKEGSCEHCGKLWQPENYGSPRKCAFENETFSGDNWNCGLVSSIRREMYNDEEEAWALRVRRDDQSFAALYVGVPSWDGTWGDGYELMGLLVATWYKDRGCCDELKWGIQDRGVESEALTRAQAIRIAAHLKAQEEAMWAREKAEHEARMNPHPAQPAAQSWVSFPVSNVTITSPAVPSSGGNRAQRRAAARGKP